MIFKKRDPWYTRLARALGLDPDSRQAHDAARSTSKHLRAKAKPCNWVRIRKVRRKMAKMSRRINRRK